MGAAGKKLHGHGARRKSNSPSASVSDGGYGLPPHPTRIRAGQTFWRRTSPGRRRRPFVVCTITDDGSVHGRRIDASRERVRVSLGLLTQTRLDGQGEHYQFGVWTPRRYRTWAAVVAVEAQHTILVLPEWHPGRPVRFPTRLVPADARRPGAWLTVKADLSSTSAGPLNLSEIARCADPGCSRCPAPMWQVAP